MLDHIVSIGTISTPYKSLKECPFNVDDEAGALCELRLDDNFKDGLKGLKPGQKIDILYWLHNSERDVMLQESHFKEENSGENTIGTFALRSPWRPNPIGLAKLTIVDIQGGRITVRGLDCLDGSHLIDIKPSIA